MKIQRLFLFIFVVVVISCKKEITTTTNHVSDIYNKLNTYRFGSNFSEKNCLLEKFQTNLLSYKNNLKEDLPPETAEMGRYIMETTLNSFHAGVAENGTSCIQMDTISISILNDELTPLGEPILNGESFYSEYSKLQEYIDSINLTPRPTSMVGMQITYFDESNTSFDVYIATDTGTFVGLPSALLPSETPAPFVNENYPAMSSTNPTIHGADYYITNKLNAHRTSQQSWAIVEIMWPAWEESWSIDCQFGFPPYWHAYSNTPLSTDQLNSYLTAYKARVDFFASQAAFYGYLIHHVQVYSHNGWTECAWWGQIPCPACPTNSTIYDWHFMVIWKCNIYLKSEE